MSFDNIRLEKGMYSTGKSFTQNLELLDPSENYIGTEYEGLDAYQRQLKRFDIKPSGPDSSVVGKFFQSSDASVLFPEYVSRAVRYGLDDTAQIKDIVASITEIDSATYRTMNLNTTTHDLTEFAEGGLIAEAKFTVDDSIIKLKRRGRYINVSYDVLRFQKLDVLSIMLKKIGAGLSYTLMNDAIEVLVSGNGENGKGALNYKLVDKEFTYNALVELWADFAPYQLTTIIAPSTVVSGILKQPEFRVSGAGLEFSLNGKLITPFGAQLVQTMALTGYSAFAIDKNYALEMVKVGDIETNYGKLIDRQLEQISITTMTGFAQILNEAAMLVDPAD